MNALRRWLIKRQVDRALQNAKATAEIAAREDRMRKQGICLACYGAGGYDDPPWGILRCNHCGGTGRKP